MYDVAKEIAGKSNKKSKEYRKNTDIMICRNGFLTGICFLFYIKNSEGFVCEYKQISRQ